MRIFEEPSGPNSLRAVRRLDQIVALLAMVLPPEWIDEGERRGELFCPDQESAAIRLPFTFCFVHVCSPLGEGI